MLMWREWPSHYISMAVNGQLIILEEKKWFEQMAIFLLLLGSSLLCNLVYMLRGRTKDYSTFKHSRCCWYGLFNPSFLGHPLPDTKKHTGPESFGQTLGGNVFFPSFTPIPLTTKMAYDITIQMINLKKNTVTKSNVIFPNLGSENNNNTWTTIYSIKHPLLFFSAGGSA